MTEKRKMSFQQQAEQNVEATAWQVARSIQTPGQTKEQTKLIAQGISKGIALYKKQQSEKMREREKVRKRLLKERLKPQPQGEEGPLEGIHQSMRPSAVAAVWCAGMLFAGVTVLHLWRLFSGLPILLGTWSIPVWWSLPVAVMTGVMALWLFFEGSKSRLRAVC